MSTREINVESYTVNVVDSVREFIKCRQRWRDTPAEILYVLTCIVRDTSRQEGLEPVTSENL